MQAVQVALLILALSSVAMFVFWRQLSSAGVWLMYTAGAVKGGEGRDLVHIAYMAHTYLAGFHFRLVSDRLPP